MAGFISVAPWMLAMTTPVTGSPGSAALKTEPVGNTALSKEQPTATTSGTAVGSVVKL